jgi:hypothetical protein
MTVDASGADPIRLSGPCTLEDAEALLRALLNQPGRRVDWGSVTSAHTAVIQVLIALRPGIDGTPASDNLRDWIQPLVRGRDIAAA